MVAESYPQPSGDFVDKVGYLSTSYPHSAVRPAKVIHKPKNVIHISTRASSERASYPHYPQNIHKVIPKVIHTSVQASSKIIHIVENVIHISTQASSERASYPHYPQNIHKVIPKVIHTQP
jgi:hypothetical protein